MLTFQPAEHRYFWNGKPVPNVTSVIGHLSDYSMVPPDKLEVARQKGQAVHSMVEMHCKGILDIDELPEWLVPVLHRWVAFVAETGFRVIASERLVHHSTYAYAGTLDLYGELAHAAEFAFLDVKRSFLAGRVIGLQLAAYKGAYIDQEKADRGARSAKRYGLKLNENGPYRMEPYEDDSQFQEFLTCLAHQRVKEKYL